MDNNIKEQIEGYKELVRENEVLRKHSIDRTLYRGQVAQIVNRLHPKELQLQISEIRQETETTKTLRLVSKDGHLPPFLAGQYINLFVEIGGVRTSRPYSISSTPNQTAFYDITIRRVAEGFVSTYLLDEVNVGDRFTSSAPTGLFHHNPLFHGNDLVFLAGGSGITPFMSMIREVTDCNLKRNIHLIYGNFSEQDIVFNDELSDRESHHDNLTVSRVISDPTSSFSGLKGFITADLIKKLTQPIEQKTFYVCGPEAMYRFVLVELENMGIPKRKIRVEVFGAPAKVEEEPGWPTEIKPDDCFQIKLKNGTTIKSRAGEPLMNSLERNGIVLPALCRSGECSLCRTKLLSGKVFQPKGVKLRKSDRIFGYIHPCLAYPLEDLELLLHQKSD